MGIQFNTSRLTTPQPANTGLRGPVGLLNTYSSRNLGDAAIMATLAKLSQEATDVARPALATLTGADEIIIPSVKATASLDDCNAFISVGGDIFNNARPNLLTRTFLRNVAALYDRRAQALVFGQSIPASCKGMGLSMLASVLRSTAAVVVRDEESHALLRAKGVDAALSYDVAFALDRSMADLDRARGLYEQSNLDPQQTVLLSVRSFDPLYPHDQAGFIHSMCAVADKLHRRGHQVAVLVQSDVGEADSDRTIAREIADTIDGVKILDCFDPIAETANLETLLAALRLARGCVAVRYHAAVLMLAQGRQPFNLSYSRKGRDLGKRLGLSGADLSGFCPHEAIPLIEATFDQPFATATVSRHVRDAFFDACRKLPS